MVAATTPPSTPTSPVASFVVPAGKWVAPKVRVDGDTVIWSAFEDGAWVLRGSVGGVPIAKVLERQGADRPIDFTVGHAAGAPPVTIFSRCPTAKHSAKGRKGSCDLYRLTTDSESGVAVPLRTVSGDDADALRGVNTRTADELSPSLSGHSLVFARWPKGPVPGKLIRRDTRTGVETELRRGSKGDCMKRCSWDGAYANGPLETAVSGNGYAQRWTYFGGPDAFGVDSTDVVYRGQFGSRKRSTLVESFVDGAGSGSAFYNDLQLFGSVSQMVVSVWDTDSAPPKPGEHDYLIRKDGKQWSTYKDPAGRRIVSASGDGDTLWVITDAKAVPAGTPDDESPQLCSAEVGGCVLEAIPMPTFEPWDG